VSAEKPEQEPVTVTDKRRIDPETFEVRDADAEAQVIDVESEALAAADEAALTAEPSPETAALAERTADLQRVTAEYANYRRRIEREKVAAIEGAKASVVGQFLDLVDDLDRARSHGDLEAGPMKALSDKLTGILTGLGLEAFGAEGDPFEPDLHEAVHMEGDGTNPVLGTVLRKGYRLGDRVLRHAMVTVTDGDPNDTPAQTSPDESGTE
jgi:molecular chaperone GrpE